jgi:hypothetical protein
LKPMIVLLLSVVACAAAAFGVVSCGGDDDKSKSSTSASQGQTGPSTRKSADGGAGGGRSGETKSRTPGSAGNDGGSPETGSGGARAPRLDRPVRKRTLQRYLASNFREAPWYPMLERLRIAGAHVSVYLNFSPENDDENPPVMACTAVLSYGRQVKQVTVYGLPTSQGKTAIMKEC